MIDKETKKFFAYLLFSIFLSLLIFLIPAFRDSTSVTIGVVSGESMLPTLTEGERVYAVDREPEYEDIVIVLQDEAYSHFLKSNIGNRMIKRVIGLPGDTIKITEEGVYRNGELLEESYLPEENRNQSYRSDLYYTECVLGDGECFVLGDNRAVSMDSRSVGPVTLENVHVVGTEKTLYAYRYNIVLYGCYILLAIMIIRIWLLSRTAKTDR